MFTKVFCHCYGPVTRYQVKIIAMDAMPAYVETPEVHVSLVAERASVQAGNSIWFALRIAHKTHWHTYWLNAGDSGLPTKALFDLPAGVRMSKLQWPHPKRLRLGDLVNFGYEDVLYVPVELHLEPAYRGSEVRLGATISWLACKEECIPGKAELLLRVPVRDGPGSDQPGSDESAAPSEHAQGIAAARKRVPALVDWPLSMRELDTGFELKLADAGLNEAEFELFPFSPQVWANGAPSVTRDGTTWRFKVARSEYFAGLPKDFSVLMVDHHTGASYAVPVAP